MNSDADVGVKTLNDEAFGVGGTLDTKRQVHLPNLVMKQIIAFSWTSKTTIMTFKKIESVHGWHDILDEDEDELPWGDGGFLQIDHYVHRAVVPRYLVPIDVDYDAYLRSIGLEGWAHCATTRPLVKSRKWIVSTGEVSHMCREWGYSFFDGMETECQKLTQVLIEGMSYYARDKPVESEEDE